MEVRFDRGSLKRPERKGGALVVEGYTARTHKPGDPLRYAHGDEYRDLAELKRIVEQLPGKPVVLPHPPKLIKRGAKPRIVGRVDAAWIDGESAAVRLHITDAAAARDLEAARDRADESAKPQLSLGYEVDVDARSYQRDTDVDHVAIVGSARCGDKCSLRTDERMDCSATCACQLVPSQGEEGIMADQKTDKQRADELETTVETLNQRIKTLEADIAAGAQAAETEALRKEKERADAADDKLRKVEQRYQADVRARVTLVAQASAVLGREVRLDDMTDRQIHETVIKRLDASVNVSSENDDQVRGRYNTLLALASRNAESQARVAEILGRGNEEQQRKDHAAESFEDHEKNRWKNTLKNGRTAAEGQR